MKRLVPAVRHCAIRIARSGFAVSGLLLCMLSASVDANPSGGVVTHGSATINYGPNMTVNLGSSNVIINWDHFGIGAGEQLHFDMLSNWRVLNRVTGNASSFLNGLMTANGQVYIVNRNGITFGANSMMNAGRLYAATGSMSDADFLGGVDRFTNLSGTNRIEFQTGSSFNADELHFVGGRAHRAIHVREGAVIEAPIVSMATGENEVMISRLGDRIHLRIDGQDMDASNPTAGVNDPSTTGLVSIMNEGTIATGQAGGQITLNSGDLCGIGILNTSTARIEADGGSIELAAAGGSIYNQAGSRVQADTVGSSTGSITIGADAVVINGLVAADEEQFGADAAGSIDINGVCNTFFGSSAILSANSMNGTAGDIDVDTSFGTTYFHPGSSVTTIASSLFGQNGGNISVSGERLFYRANTKVGGRTGDGSFSATARGGNFEVRGSTTGYALSDLEAADMSQASFSDLLVGAINCESQIGAQILNPLDGDLTLEATGGTLRILDGFGLNGGGNRHDATLRAGRNIDFDAAITGLQDLTARAGTDGNGSVNIRTSLLDIDGDAVFAAADDINLSPTFPFINIWTNGSQTYDGDLVANATAQLISWQNGGLELTGDLLFDGSPFVLMRSVGGSVYVDGSIDTSFAGLGRFVANAQTGNVWINGDIGAVNPLNAMELTAEDGLILLSGDLVRAREDIFLNNFEGQRTAFADIIGLSDNLEIRSENGGIYIGKNHKFTQLGDLTLRAINGEITLNDVSTFGNLLVDSPMISIFLREPLDILTYLGFDVESFVVNFVAGGSISFTSAPTTVGDGGTPWFSSVNDSPDESTTLEDFVWWQNVPLDMQDFYFDTVVLVLEAVQQSSPDPPEPPIPPDPPQPPGPPNPPVPPAPPAPNPDDPSLAIAEGSQIAEPPVDLLIFADSDTDGSILLTDLGDIGIEVEGPANSNSELRGSLSRSRVVSDYTANAINVNPDTGNIRVKQARISTKVTDQALQEYQNVLVRQPGDTTTILEQNQTTAMSDSIQQAWTSYRDSAGSDATGDGFRTWLDSSGNTQAREFVNGLRTVYTTLEASGLNGPELNHARNTTMGRILKSGTSQSGMSTADLSAATGS